MIEIDDRGSDGDGVFQYCIKIRKRLYRPYSGRFETQKLANAWYVKYGMWLENQFDRKLHLVKDSNGEWLQ